MMVSLHHLHSARNLRTRQFRIFPREVGPVVVLQVASGEEVEIAIGDFHHATADILGRALVRAGNLRRICNDNVFFLREVESLMKVVSARGVKNRKFFAFGSYTLAAASVRLLLEQATALGFEPITLPVGTEMSEFRGSWRNCDENHTLQWRAFHPQKLLCGPPVLPSL